MTEFLEVYSQTGMVGIVGMMCVYMVYSNVKTSHKNTEDISRQSETIENVEGMIIKLIERWNRSDESRDRRHEDLIKEINDVSDDLNYLKGKANGK
tara:strand:+ start:205 stop:492 length:288 start_codon:yes stop_codon:yes gene_type:complete